METRLVGLQPMSRDVRHILPQAPSVTDAPYRMGKAVGRGCVTLVRAGRQPRARIPILPGPIPIPSSISNLSSVRLIYSSLFLYVRFSFLWLFSSNPLSTMIIRSLLAAGALSLGASAFLVVPELDTSVQPPESVHHFDAHNAHTQEVRLACTECPFPEVGANGKISWTDGFDTSLVCLTPPPPLTPLYPTSPGLRAWES